MLKKTKTTILNLYLFLYIFKLWTKQLYEDGNSSCLDHYSSLKGIPRGNICQHPGSFKLENKIQKKVHPEPPVSDEKQWQCIVKIERTGEDKAIN